MLLTACEVGQAAKSDERDLVGIGDMCHCCTFHVEHIGIESLSHVFAKLLVVDKSLARNALTAHHDFRLVRQTFAFGSTILQHDRARRRLRDLQKPRIDLKPGAIMLKDCTAESKCLTHKPKVV